MRKTAKEVEVAMKAAPINEFYVILLWKVQLLIE